MQIGTQVFLFYSIGNNLLLSVFDAQIFLYLLHEDS